MFGLINVLKPEKLTSRDVVNCIQRRARPHKVGHAGTLDPLATGVLVVGIGPATRLLGYVHDMDKQYRAAFLLGKRSDTDDTEGQVVDDPRGPIPSRPEVAAVVEQFTGQILQIPPAYSAIKVAGRRSYELARKGIRPALKARNVCVHKLRVVGYEYPRLELDVVCGGGTYIRALGRDIAVRLGTSAVMSELTRTRIGSFDLSNAIPLDRIKSNPIDGLLLPPETALGGLARIELTTDEAQEIAHGRSIARDESCPEGEIAGFFRGELVAILRGAQGRIATVRNFSRWRDLTGGP